MPNRDAETPGRGGDIDWKSVKRVLVVRLRSIGDTVLATPALIALRRFLPDAQIDILLEDWVAPLLEGFEPVSNVITVSRKSKKSRFDVARRIRRERYDVAFNLHGGTTATFFVRASGARVRVGYSHYRYGFLYSHLLTSSSDFWNAEKTHSAEQQLALPGFVGVPVDDRPKSQIAVTAAARASLAGKLIPEIADPSARLAVIHPVAAFASKSWPIANFARIAEYLTSKGLKVIAVGSATERSVLDELSENSRASVTTFNNLSIPEFTALVSRAEIFVGNDSGLAHIAAARQIPSVVVFGSSNIAHWRPWTDAPHEVVFEKLPCQPCAGYVCKEFSEPKCIQSVTVESVIGAVERLLSRQK